MSVHSSHLPRRIAAACSVSLFALLSTNAAEAQFSPPRPQMPPTIAGYYNFADATQNVFYLDQDGKLWDATCNTSSCWSNTNIAAADKMAPGSPLLAYEDNLGVGRIFFLEIPAAFANCPTTVDICEQRGNPPTTFYDISASLSLSMSPGANVSWNAYGHCGGGGCLGAFNGALFLDSTGGKHMGTPFSSNLVGFQDDVAYTPTHHVFYFGRTPSGCSFANAITPELYELYDGTDYSDAGWINHQIATVTPQYNELPTGLTALWDHHVEHVYWNPAPGVLNQTYFSGGWWTNSLNTPPLSNAPLFSMAAMNPGTVNVQWIWGAQWSTQNQGSASNAVQFLFNGSSWGSTSVSAPNFPPNSGTLSYSWHDRTTAGLGGCCGSGTDGGVFWAWNGSLYMYVPGFSAVTLRTDVTTRTTAYSATTNQLAGYYDGTNIHVFYVDTNGFLDEIYMSANNITNSTLCSGCWSWHHLFATANAAY